MNRKTILFWAAVMLAVIVGLVLLWVVIPSRRFVTQ